MSVLGKSRVKVDWSTKFAEQTLKAISDVHKVDDGEYVVRLGRSLYKLRGIFDETLLRDLSQDVADKVELDKVDMRDLTKII